MHILNKDTPIWVKIGVPLDNSSKVFLLFLEPYRIIFLSLSFSLSLPNFWEILRKTDMVNGKKKECCRTNLCLFRIHSCLKAVEKKMDLMSFFHI